MRTTLLTCLFSVFVALQSLFAAGQVSIVDFKVRQRYPWNGLVDLDLTMDGITDKIGVYETGFCVTNLETMTALPVLTFVSRPTLTTNGTYRFVWDAGKDLGEQVMTNLAAYVQVSQISPRTVQLWENGPYWAEMNIGAEKPWDPGYYFWWGDTIGYVRTNDQWVASDGSVVGFNFEEDTNIRGFPYTNLVNQGWIKDDALTPAHDAASVHWGKNWRMPTSDEMQALVDNTDWKWTTTNGMGGLLLKGRGEYSNVSLFLPAPGFSSGTTLENYGEFGSYWSSTPYPDENNSWNLDVSAEGGEVTSIDRYFADPVRPLWNASSTPPGTEGPVTAGHPVRFSLDLSGSPRVAKDIEMIRYSTEWYGGNPVMISVNGESLGSFPAPADSALAWNTADLRNGEYTLTFADGVTNLTASFMITNHLFTVFEINGTTNWADSVNYKGVYDGKAHGIRVEVDSPSEAVVSFSLSESGPFSATKPTWSDAVSTSLWFRVEAPEYRTLITNATVSITPKTLTADQVSQPADTLYTGAQVTPALTVSDTLPCVVTPLDYTLSYQDNQDVGTASVTVTGVRNYTGKVTHSFEILPAPIRPGGSEPDNEGEGALSRYAFTGMYDGTGHTLDTDALESLSIGTDPLTFAYSLSEEGPYGPEAPCFTNVCSTSVWYRISAPNHVDYRHEAAVTVTNRPISLATIGSVADVTYTGSAFEPTVTVSDVPPCVVTAEDYEVSYSNNLNAGTARIRITGRGNYSGEAERAFTILPAEIRPDGNDPDNEGGGLPSLYDFTGIYDGIGHTIDTWALESLSIGTDPLTFGYSLSEEGPYGAEAPCFTNVCSTSIWYRISAPNHVPYLHEAAVTITNVVVTVPSLASKSYSGQLQVADIAESPLYTVTANEGGIDVGSYGVTLKLVDSLNFVWSTTTADTVVLPFQITRAANCWTLAPSIAGWVYGNSPAVPAAVSKFGLPAITYSGTTSAGIPVVNAASVHAAGSYTAHFTVGETPNYTGLAAEVPFTVSRGSLDGESSSGAFVVAEGYEGLYDGEGHTISVRVENPGSDRFTLTYAGEENGTFTDTPPLYTNAVSTSIWYRVESDNYQTVTGSERVVISPYVGLDGEIAWTFARATGTYFAQIKVACTNGLATGVEELRFIFADRKSGDITLASLWCSHPSRRGAIGETLTLDGVTYRYVDLDASRLASEGGEAVYGVRDLSVAPVPEGEREIELYVAKRVPPSGGNELQAGVDDFVGYLTWKAHGREWSLPLVENERARFALNSLPLSSPVPASALNMALAVGVAPEQGGSAYCKLERFSIGEREIFGRLAVGARDGRQTKIQGTLGSNAKVILTGATRLGEPFKACGEVSVQTDGSFVFPKPEKYRFFRIRLQARKIVQ